MEGWIVGPKQTKNGPIDMHSTGPTTNQEGSD